MLNATTSRWSKDAVQLDQGESKRFVSDSDGADGLCSFVVFYERLTHFMDQRLYRFLVVKPDWSHLNYTLYTDVGTAGRVTDWG